MNPYEVLGLPLTATRKQIDVAYRAKAKRYHPDINTAAEANARMARINEAYEMITKGWRPAPAPTLRDAEVVYARYYTSVTYFVDATRPIGGFWR